MPGESITTTAPAHQGTVKKSATDFLADEYLARLLSFSVEAIRKEPENLQNQKAALKQEVLETALTHYQGFIEAASCFQEISAHVKKLKEELTNLSECLDSLQEQANSFGATAAAYKEKRQGHQILMSQHATMLDILEVPQLIDTCVRNNSYDEALDLLGLMAKLSVVAGNTSVVQKLCFEAAEARTGLQKQLLSRLGQNTTLPECLRCVSYLRRLSAFSESDLRLQFLQQRDSWCAFFFGAYRSFPLQWTCNVNGNGPFFLSKWGSKGRPPYKIGFRSVVAEIDETNIPDYIRQYTDAHRVHLFDIIMQFRAIFYDGGDSTAAGDAAATTGGAAAGKGGVEGGSTGDGARVPVSPVLASWAHQRMETFVDRLDTLLPSVQDGSTLATLVEACMYCGRSLARVGLDFRGLLECSIERAAHGLFHHHVVRAVALFTAAVESHRWVQLPVARSAAAGAKSSGASTTEVIADATAPLMAHPPLAVLANAVILALNAARTIALSATRAACGRDLHEALRDACTVLAHVPSARDLSASELSAHLSACQCMLDTLAPLVEKLFLQVYGGSSPPQTLDVEEATAALAAHVAERAPAADAPATTGRPATKQPTPAVAKVSNTHSDAGEQGVAAASMPSISDDV